MKYIIKDQECGYLLKDGIFQRVLNAGKHRYSVKLGYSVKIVPMTGYVKTCDIPVDILMKNTEFAAKVIYRQIPDDCIAIHYVNNTYKTVLTDREALCWNVFDKNEFRLVSFESPYMDETMPRMYIELLPIKLYKRIVIEEGERGLLYFDNRLEKELECGTHFFWNHITKVSCKIFNLKIQQLDITGQEILTADKVGIRLNIICNYQITDPRTLVKKIEGLKDQLHVYTQLIVREYAGKYRLDELLEQKEEIGHFVYNRLLENQEQYCVKFINVGIKDIILPGEIREIMNTVLIAEKRAQANVITRREEVASTRSLLNTAKLMDENKTLFKLKELEFLEKICERVGNISVGGGNGILEQLSELITVNN